MPNGKPTACQRWLFQQDRYRPAGETIDPRRYEVAAIGAGDANAFVKTHHYAGTPVYDRFRFGMFEAGRLMGVAIFSVPVNSKSVEMFPGDAVELGRFVLLDSVPANGETWFLARTFDELRRHEIAGVISFSDPVPRRAADGRTVFKGHLGIIYQAFNGAYVGRSAARTLRLWPDGRVVSTRRIQKVRKLEKGWKPAVAEFRAFGADELWADRRAWLKHWLGRLTTPLHHPGNHKYLWSLDRRVQLPASLPYPKQVVM